MIRILTTIARTLPVYLTMTILSLAQAPAGGDNTAGPSFIAIDHEAVRLTKVVTAIRITEGISFDGRLNEPAWDTAEPASDLIQWRPNNGAPATERTEVRFLYDEDNLYVGISCFDSDGQIAVNELKEDFNWGQSDVLTLFLDSLHDERSGFYFTTNAGGAKRDGQIFNDGQMNVDWDGVWDVRVTRNEEGWFGEFVIPFKTLRFSSAPSQEWGVNFDRRIVAGRYEEATWSPIPLRFGPLRASMAGTLKGLEGIRQGRNLKIKPFITGGVTQVRTEGQLETVQSLGKLKDYAGGVDLKYSLTPSVTLDATYHTDFSQVEVDQQQVNLTRYNLFFPEKREFFLENAGTFTFGPADNLVPFFSRRIGLSAAGTPIPIVGGARVSGKLNQYDVGFLTMKTERLGTTPSNNYTVGRVKRNLIRSSWVGALLTNRDSTVAGDYNRVYGVDVHFLFFDRLEFDSYVLRSDSPGKSGENQARRFQSAWNDDELVINAEYNSVQANFNPEVGFVRRSNVAHYLGEISWKPLLRQRPTIRNLVFGAGVDYNEGASSGKIETRTQNVNLGIQFENNSSVTFMLDQTFDRLGNAFLMRSRRQGHSSDLPIPTGDYDYLGYSVNFTTNPARKIAGNSTIRWGEFWNGRRKSIAGSLSVKPNFHLSFDVNYERNQVSLPNGSFTTNLVGARLLYAFTPRAFFNAFIQYNADTHQVSTNIRFNLIHRPLSDFYLVYNERRNTAIGQLVERAFIVKLTNLFNF